MDKNRYIEDKIYTLDEVSKYLKLSKSTLYKLSQTGRMPSVKIGKQLRFRKSSIDNWLSEKESRTTNSESRPPKKVLLIDDDTLVLRAVSKLLQHNGYNVMAVE